MENYFSYYIALAFLLIFRVEKRTNFTPQTGI